MLSRHALSGDGMETNATDAEAQPDMQGATMWLGDALGR